MILHTSPIQKTSGKITKPKTMRAKGSRARKLAHGKKPGTATNENPTVFGEGFSPDIINNLATPAFVVKVLPDNEYSLINLNHAHQKATWLNLEQIQGRPLHECLPPETARQLAANYTCCKEMRQPYSYDENLSLPSGEKHWKTNLSPVFDETGNVTHLIGTACEFTREVDQLQREIKRYSRLMETYQEYQDNFNAAAHDLRSPIGQIDAAIKLMVMHNNRMKDDKCNQLLDLAQDMIEKLLSHLDMVLEKGRPRTINESKLSVFNLQKTAREIRTILDPMGKLNFTIEQNCIRAEKILVEIVLRNRVDNAIKHNKNCPSLEINVCATQATQAMVQFTVADNGKGMDDPMSVFHRAGSKRPSGRSKSSQNKIHGLPTIRRMIASRGGDLQLSNSKDGFIAAFTLPGRIVARTH